jgi:hypothetical protein
MKRRFALTLIFLLAGAVVNVAVRWHGPKGTVHGGTEMNNREMLGLPASAAWTLASASTVIRARTLPPIWTGSLVLSWISNCSS